MKHHFPENGSSCLPKNLIWPQASRNAALRLSDGCCICVHGKIHLTFHREQHAVVGESLIFSRMERRIPEFLPPSPTLHLNICFFTDLDEFHLSEICRTRGNVSLKFLSTIWLTVCLLQLAFMTERSSEPVLEEGLQHCCGFEGKTRKICHLLVCESQWWTVGLQVQLLHAISF